MTISDVPVLSFSKDIFSDLAAEVRETGVKAAVDDNKERNEMSLNIVTSLLLYSFVSFK